MEVKQISLSDAEFEAAYDLYKRHKRTLGFLPKGAFEEAASNGELLGAVNEGRLRGYLLFRRRLRSGSVSITHLCTDPTLRSSGVARSLVDSLVSIEKGASYFDLLCRRDYEASAVWPRLSFVARGERHGRAGVVQRWCRENENAEQLQFIFGNAGSDRARPLLAIDANVFFDLRNWSEGLDVDSDSPTLLADWLESEIEVAVTAELANEITRSDSANRRALSRRFAGTFPELPISHDRFEGDLTALCELFKSDRFDSDRRQMARASSGNADCFVTRDTYLLDRASEITGAIGLPVYSPTEIAIRVDELRRERAYRPSRVRGSQIKVRKYSSADTDTALRTFIDSGAGETRNELRNRILGAAGEADLGRVEIFEDVRGDMIGLAAQSVSVIEKATVATIELVRISTRDRILGSTLLREICCRIIETAKADRVDIVRVPGTASDGEFFEALGEFGFREENDCWLKFLSGGPLSFRDLRESLSLKYSSSQFARAAGRLIESVQVAIESNDNESRAAAELLCWPARIRDALLPCYVIPIRPVWAMHLFDAELASADMFGADARLAFSNENVYYCRYGGRQLPAPARVAWYVSQDSRVPESSHIRAVSTIASFEIGPARVLYRRNQRFGVFEWRDIMELTNNDPDAELVCVHFRCSESLATPVSFTRAQEILTESEARRNQFISITPIEIDTFFRIYEEGVR